MYTLRNNDEPEVRKTIKKFLRNNDYVRNRERQDPRAVLKLCNKDLTEYITNIGYICHTIIPETVRSKLPIVSTPIQILSIYVLDLMVIFFFLTHGETRKLSNIYKVQDITLVCSNVKGRGITFFLQETYRLCPLQ